MTSYYPPTDPMLSAPVAGIAAFALTRLLPRSVVVARTQGLTADDRRMVIAAWDAMNKAANEWTEWKTGERSPSGSPEAHEPPVEGHSESEQDRPVPTDEAAARLGLSTRRIRQLLDAGRLRGYTSAGRWFVHAESLEDYELSRRAA